MKATITLANGDTLKVDEARKDLKAEASAIRNFIDEGRKATLAGAKRLHAVKVSGLYLASLTVREIAEVNADGRKTAWSSFYASAGLTKTQASRLVAMVDTIDGLKANGVPQATAEGLAADTLRALWSASDKNPAEAASMVKAIEANGDKVNGPTVRALATEQGKNDPTDPKPVSIGKAVSMVLRAIDSDRPIDYGTVSLETIDHAIEGLQAARVNLASKLAQAEAEADMAEADDDDELSEAA